MLRPSKKHKAHGTSGISVKSVAKTALHAILAAPAHVSTVLTDMLYSNTKIAENKSIKTIYYNDTPLEQDSDCCDGSVNEADIINYVDSTGSNSFAHFFFKYRLSAIQIQKRIQYTIYGGEPHMTFQMECQWVIWNYSTTP